MRSTMDMYRSLSLFTTNIWDTIKNQLYNAWYHIYSSIFWISSLASCTSRPKAQDISTKSTSSVSLNRSISFDLSTLSPKQVHPYDYDQDYDQDQVSYFNRSLFKRHRPPLPNFSNTFTDEPRDHQIPAQPELNSIISAGDREKPTRRSFRNHFQTLKHRQLSLNDVKRSLFPRRQSKVNTADSVPNSPIPSHQIVYLSDPTTPTITDTPTSTTDIIATTTAVDLAGSVPISTSTSTSTSASLPILASVESIKADCIHRRRSVSDVLLRSISAWKQKDSRAISRQEPWNVSAPDLFNPSVQSLNTGSNSPSIPTGLSDLGNLEDLGDPNDFSNLGGFSSSCSSNKDRILSKSQSFALFRRKTTIGSSSNRK
ncbi:hypothetical protein F4703DRAFT_1567842 [Phycomyces blakesleeanus]